MYFLSGYQVLTSIKRSYLSERKRQTELLQSQICVSAAFKVAQFLMPVFLYKQLKLFEIIPHPLNFKDATVYHTKK